MAAHTKEAEVYNGVSTADVPSAAWGWSELSRRSIVISGVIGGLFLLGMLFGNHEGNVENIWLIGLAVVTLVGTALFVIRPKGTQRRTVTAHNKPLDHVEPQWAADQRNLTGVYSQLSDDQLRAWNVDPRHREELPGDKH
ncbi:MAG TPA: DUF2631 domain-containing protein [Candidatus Corynebacterium gallistercoris]|uniref:DUF2631 domain-containing protein n=1 Tax=Candidatus Corynebacterium gallistercoris TaxID=2838530 RepID=A0A9D1URP2_9CORY|nr:DUF2631 domain-containing protein [Candidatus Corynebacterium gallistercoris]